MKSSGKAFKVLFMVFLLFMLAGVGGSFSGKAEASTRVIGDLEIGDRLFDSGWTWQFRSGNNYNYQYGDGTDAVIWIVVAKDHYGEGTGVTLLSESVIGRYHYESQERNEPNNLWALSQLQLWLNSSTGIRVYPSVPGFRAAFSDFFKSKIVTTGSYPNYWVGLPDFPHYNLDLNVFIPSTTELGDPYHNFTVEIGEPFEYFIDAGDAKRIAKLQAANMNYWTRSPRMQPALDNEVAVRIVGSSGGFLSSVVHEQSIGVRPALNLRSDTICVSAGMQGFYQILNPPGKVILKSPANNANADGTAITLEWNPAGENQWEEDMIKYELTASGGNQLFKISDISGNSYTISNLPNDNTVFNWVVKAYNPAGFGESSAVWSFVNGSVPNGSLLTWTTITDSAARALAYDGGLLAGSFEGYGIGTYDGSWTNLTAATAQALATDGNNLVASVEGFGVWRYDGSWTQIADATARLLAIDNGVIAASFDGYGVWLYDGIEWVNLNSVTAQTLAFENGKLAASFAGLGTWQYNGSWQQLTDATADVMVMSGNSIVASFDQQGIWIYDGSWTSLTLASALALALDDGVLAASFDGFGTWLYDGEWQELTTAIAEHLGMDSSRLAASFEGYGVWLYE